MATSQNGWPVVPDTTAGRAKLDRGPLIRDITVPNGVLAGDVAFVFRWLAREYDRRVERLAGGECWGWFVKKIEGSDTYSNHAAGCAVDFNAPDNPMGVPTTRSMTAAQIAECHELERESGGVLRWGGDFSRPDPMHWEIVGTAAQVATLANRIEEQNVTAPTAAQNADAVAAKDIDPGPGGYSWAGATWTILARSNILNALPGQLTDLRDELDARVQDVDDELDGMGASLALVVAMLHQLLADPSDVGPGHPIVQCLKYYFEQVAPNMPQAQS